MHLSRENEYMSQRFSTQVFVPTERFLRQIASAVLATLDGAGFAFERQRGQGGRYWVHEDLDWRETDRLEEIWDQFDKPGEWSIELWKSRPNGEDRELHLSVER